MRRRAVAVLAMTPLLMLGPAGCMFGGGNKAGHGAARSGDDDAAKMRAFAKCMRDHGIPMSDPQVDGKGRVSISMGGGDAGKAPDKQAMDKADAACRHLMPNGGKPPKPKPEDLAKMRAMSKCMRQHGITDFPDPDPDGHVTIDSRTGGGHIDPSSQTFVDAQKICDKLGPQGGKGQVRSDSGGSTGAGVSRSGGSGG